MKQIHPRSYWKLKHVKLNRLQKELVSKLVSSSAVGPAVGGAAGALEVPIQSWGGGGAGKVPHAAGDAPARAEREGGSARTRSKRVKRTPCSVPEPHFGKLGDEKPWLRRQLPPHPVS